MLDNDLQSNALAMGQQLTAALAPVAEKTPWIAELRGKGLMQAIETVHPGSTEPDAQRAGAILEGCKRRGLLVGKGGLYGNAIRITPMLDVSADELNEGISAIIETIEEIS